MSAITVTGSPRVGSGRVGSIGVAGFETPRTRLRLTRRGRVVFTALAGLPLVVWAAVVVLSSGAAAASGDLSAPGAVFEYVTVGAGDTLWEIAESIAPGDDPRLVVDDIVRLNGLESSAVEPGQRLALPTVD
jgi:hypothetical protein